jgi:hypothetical protein
MPLFSDGSFRNLGLRPPHEDLGWQLATRDPIDRGKFKVPTLRNVGLRNRFMHNGQLATIADVVDMYDRGGGAFPDNKDPALAPLGLSAIQKAQLVDFVRNALTDPRVAADLPPFERPTLRSEQPIQPYGAAHPGSGGIAPRPLFEAPLLVGNAEFRLGLADALGGASAAIAFAGAAGPPGQTIGPIPIHLLLTPPPILAVVPLGGCWARRGPRHAARADPNHREPRRQAALPPMARDRPRCRGRRGRIRRRRGVPSSDRLLALPSEVPP